VLGNSHAPQHHPAPSLGIHAGRAADELGLDPGCAGGLLRGITVKAGRESGKIFGARSDEGVVRQPFPHDDVRDRVQERNVRARPKAQPKIGAVGEFGAAGIGDNDLGTPLVLCPHQLACNHRMRVEWVQAHGKQHIGHSDVYRRSGWRAGADRLFQCDDARHVA